MTPEGFAQSEDGSTEPSFVVHVMRTLNRRLPKELLCTRYSAIAATSQMHRATTRREGGPVPHPRNSRVVGDPRNASLSGVCPLKHLPVYCYHVVMTASMSDNDKGMSTRVSFLDA